MDTSRRIRFPAIILILFIALLISAVALPPGDHTARAATGWEKQVSGTSLDIQDVCAVDASTAWAVAGTYPLGPAGEEDGIPLRTIDGGVNWESKPIGEPIAVTAVTAVSASTAWVAGNIDASPTIWKTTDGGASWNLVFKNSTPDSLAWIGDISAADADNVWAIRRYATFNFEYFRYDYEDKILKSTNGGDSWSENFTPGIQSGEVFPGPKPGISAVKNGVVWASSCFDIYKTTNGGTDWSSVPIDQYKLELYSCIDGVDADTAWVVDQDRGVFRSTDGGASWTQASPFVSDWRTISSVSAISAEKAWIAGDNGSIYRTSDGGNSWVIQIWDVPGDLFSVSAFDADSAWAVGGQGTILHTSDGGGAGVPITEVQSLTPESGPVGTEISIKGSGFGSTRGTSSVHCYSFDATEHVQITKYTLWSDTEIRFRLPAIKTGTIYVTVYTYRMTGGWSFAVTESPAPVVTAINPKTGVNMTKYAVEVLGTDFQATSKVRLQKGTTVINGIGVVLAKPGRLTCYLDLKSKPIGRYDVYVTNPDSKEGKLTGGFTVTNACGQGAAASVSVFAGLLGLLSVAGLGWRKRRR